MVNEKNTFGLTARDLETITTILNSFSDVREVYIFGSRAKGTDKPGSDIDLAVMNEGVGLNTIMNIKSALTESTLPYNTDVVNYPTLENSDLKEHIDRVGKLIYKKDW